MIIRNVTRNLVQFTKYSLFSSRLTRLSSTNTKADDCPLDSVTYERVCSETLEGLADYFDEILDSDNSLKSTDVVYSVSTHFSCFHKSNQRVNTLQDGVLTVHLGGNFGTYVINRQSPNKQIWLSSPTTGPKRYDFVGPATAEFGEWIYKHDGESLHYLLQKEVGNIIKEVDFFQLPYSKKL
ncbi:FXN family protein [Megaselia abdita]